MFQLKCNIPSNLDTFCARTNFPLHSLNLLRDFNFIDLILGFFTMQFTFIVYTCKMFGYQDLPSEMSLYEFSSSTFLYNYKLTDI